MTFERLAKIIKENNIPEDVHLMSDSGWECGATEMDRVWYAAEDNEIVFTQDMWKYYDERFVELNERVET